MSRVITVTQTIETDTWVRRASPIGLALQPSMPGG